MKLNPAQLSAHVAKSLLPVYVVAGEEPLLIEESLDAIRAAARTQGYSEREVFDVERGFDWSRVIEACGSMSLFATRKIVEIRMPKGPNPGRSKAAEKAAEEDDDEGETDADHGKSAIDGAKLIAEIVQRPLSDTLLLVTAGKLDYKQQQAAWYVALENAGASVYAEEIAAERWLPWVEARMRAAGLKPDADAARELAGRTEGNALAAKQDIDKLALLHPDGIIDADAVRAAVADSARFDSFDLGERMLGGDAPGAARTLSRLREEGLDVMAVLGPLVWVLRTWATAQVVFERSRDAAQACADARIFPRSRVPVFVKALQRTRSTQLYGWMRLATGIDQLAKSSGGKEQAWEELLTLVLAAAGRRVIRPT